MKNFEPSMGYEGIKNTMRDQLLEQKSTGGVSAGFLEKKLNEGRDLHKELFTKLEKLKEDSKTNESEIIKTEQSLKTRQALNTELETQLENKNS
ncbi:MAG: hypothetical protein WC795_02405 [Candidatus Paceibacterota bacterium]|jgi:hypothetical protein